MAIKLSVITVSYNSEDFIEKCLSSILKYLPQDGELIVLDNASTDKTSEIVKKFVPKIKFIQSDKNTGFSKGNNLATEHSKGEYLFFINPDTELTEPIFEKLVSFYESKDNIGIVSPKVILKSGEVQPDAVNLPTVKRAFNEFILGQKFQYTQYIPDQSQPTVVEALYGVAWLISKELFLKA